MKTLQSVGLDGTELPDLKAGIEVIVWRSFPDFRKTIAKMRATLRYALVTNLNLDLRAGLRDDARSVFRASNLLQSKIRLPT